MEFVPGDRLLPLRHSFPKADLNAARALFERFHRISETFYCGDGVWIGDLASPYPPLVRETSRRVLGYLAAYEVLQHELYRRRAVEGLERLISIQRPEGDFAWHRSSVRGIFNRNDGLYEAGIAGAAFARGFEVLGDPRLFERSGRAARWAMACPISPNMNYNLFSVWHFARHYRIAQDRRCLDAAVDKACEGALASQLANGRWPGHNSWIWYHDIIVRGLAELLGALGPDHPRRDELMAGLYKALNRYVEDQDASGYIPPNPDDIERGGRPHVEDTHDCHFTIQALSLVGMHAEIDIGPVLDGLVHYKLSQPEPEVQHAAPGTDAGWARRERTGLLQEPRRYPGEVSLLCRRFDAVEPDEAFGCRPKGWTAAWHRSHKPSPGSAVARLRPSKGRVGGTVLQFTLDEPSFAGFGLDVSDLALDPSSRYRIDVWLRVERPLGAETDALVTVTARSSDESAPPWDLWSDTAQAFEGVEHPDYVQVSLWWRPKPARRREIYVGAFLRSIPRGGRLDIYLEEVKLVREGGHAESVSGRDRYDSNVGLMAAGELLRSLSQTQV